MKLGGRPLHQMTLGAFERPGADALMALNALTVDSGRAGLHFSIFVVLLVVTLAAHLGIGGLSGLLGMTGTAGKELVVCQLFGVMMMTFEAFHVVARIVRNMLKKGITGGTSILNAVWNLGGFVGKGGEAERADNK